VVSAVGAVEPRIRVLLSAYPQMPATVIAERVGWTGSISWFRERVRAIRREYLPVDPVDRLELVNEREPLSTSSADHDKHYRYLRAILQTELSTCQFSRGNLQEAYNLGLAAVQALSIIPSDQNARVIAMKSIFDQIHNLSVGEAPAALLAIYAHLLVQLCNECEANQRKRSAISPTPSQARH
jgi:hypothetical protein